MPGASWHFKKECFESCNGEVNSACIFVSPAHYETCDAALALHVRLQLQLGRAMPSAYPLIPCGGS